jgi:hypothetical protein
VKILRIISARPIRLLLVAALWFAGGMTVLAQKNAWERKTAPMKREPVGTNSVRWHTITVVPNPGLPRIHFYNKLNPVWWLENSDEPVPPAWYLPGDKHRVTKWHFRNPFHNFDFYVIGVADKDFVRSGFYPERNSNPHGGWDFELARRKLALLPFVSYERNWITFYLGWREHGAFGAEMRFHRKATLRASRWNKSAAEPLENFL